MATLVTNFASIIRDMGTAAAVIQKSTLSDELVDTIFWTNVSLGFVLGGIIAFSSPLIAAIFREPHLHSVLILLALSLPIGCSGATQLALLERSSRFRTIAFVEISSALAGAGVAIAAASMGAGVVSLVLQSLVGATLSTSLYWCTSKWRPTWRWSLDEFLRLLNFSGNLVGFSIVNYFARNADSMLIGKFLGPVELGVYNIAYRVMLFPLQNLTFVVNRAFLPIFSEQQNNPALIGKNYLKLLQLINVVTAPLMFGLWSVRETFVLVALGQKWVAASSIIAWLAPTGYLQSIVSTIGAVLMATGKTRLLRNLGSICSLIYVLSIVLGLANGSPGVARAYFFANLVTSAIYLHYTLIQVNLRLVDVARSISRPLAAALAMAGVVCIADRSLVPHDMAPLSRLAYLVMCGATVYFSILLIAARDMLLNIRWVLASRI